MSLLGTMGVEEGKPLTFLPSFPRLQLPDTNSRPCAGCGGKTWMVGPDKEMVCNSCDHMLFAAWKMARERRSLCLSH